MLPAILTESIREDLKFEMVLVKGGTFLMGSEKVFEEPVHQVNLPDFYIGKYPVTQALWKAVMGEDQNPSEFKGDNRPVEMVSWQETQDFLKKLNQRTGRSYRLLTEAEWEYAARGGENRQGFEYAGGNKLKDVGWYDENSYGETKPVGLKYPNELGLFDMSGNVFEWVEDQWHNDYEKAPDDGTAWVDRSEGSNRVIRGGGWSLGALGCRVSVRLNNDPSDRDSDVGFRLGLSLQSAG